MADRGPEQHEMERLRMRVAELERELAAKGAHATDFAVLDEMIEGVQIVDDQMRYVYLNHAAARHGRQPRQQLIGRRMRDAYPGIEATEMFGVLQRCMQERRSLQMENEFRFPNGETGWFQLQFEPVSLGVLVLSLDITARKRLEERLRRSHDDLRSVLTCMGEGVITTDTRGRVVRLNPAAEQLTGTIEEAAVDRPLDQFVQFLDPRTHEPIVDPVRLVLTGEPAFPSSSDTLLLTRDDREVPVACSGAPLRGADGEVVGVVLVLRDVEENHVLTRMVQQAQKMEAIALLAGGIAHDFNNLLTVISGYSDVLLSTLPASSPDRGRVEQIRDAGTMAADLTRQLLAFGRRQVVRAEVLDLSGIVSRMHDLLRRLIGEDIDLVTRLEEAVHPVVFDTSHVEQIVMNLAVNARDAMRRGGKLTIETGNADLDEEYARTHPGAQAGPHAMIAVTDTGTGMDEETRERIFEPFFTTKEVGHGTGLGLSTVYGLVKQAGGNIWVYSEPGQGSTFKVYLPRTDLAPAGEAEIPVLEPADGTETILLVEDHDAVRGLLVKVLEGKGYRVLAAADPDEACRLSAGHEGAIHLMLTDVVLPGRNGRELADDLLAQRPHMRVIFMSGYTDSAIVHHGVLDPGTHFIEKPIAPSALLAKVREVLA